MAATSQVRLALLLYCCLLQQLAFFCESALKHVSRRGKHTPVGARSAGAVRLAATKNLWQILCLFVFFGGDPNMD